MGTIDFPSSPTTGQTYTLAGKIWEYDGVKWTITTKIVKQNFDYWLGGRPLPGVE